MTATAIGQLIQFGLIIALAQWLSVSTFAAFVTAAAIVGFGEMASDFGVRISATRSFARGAAGDGAFFPILLAKTIYSALLLAVLVSLPLKLFTPSQTLLAGLVACTQPSTDPLLWRLRGRERLDLEALLLLGWRSVNAVVLGTLAASGAGLHALLLAWLANNLLRGWVAWRLPVARLEQHCQSLPALAAEAGKIIRDAFPVGLAFLIMALFQRIAVVLLGQRGSAPEVAWFGAAFTPVASCAFVATSITVATFAALSRAGTAGDWTSASAHTQSTLRWIGTVFFPVCLIGGILAPTFVSLVYPEGFAPAADTMVYLLPGLYISCLNFALKYLMSVLHLNWLDTLAVLSGLAVLAMIVLLAPEGELLRMTAIAWGAGETVILLIRFWLIARDGRIRGLVLEQHLVAAGLLAFLLLNFH